MFKKKKKKKKKKKASFLLYNVSIYLVFFWLKKTKSFL